MSQATRFEVQTRYHGGTWENCWQEDDEPQYYDTHDDAMAGIYEFFADLHRAQMAHHYEWEDYRVVQTAG